MTILDADGRQELALKRLEGCDEMDCIRHAIAACNRNSLKRQLGMLDPCNRGPMVLDFADDWRHHTSMTVDARDDEQRELDWARRDTVYPLLDLCTPAQRAVLEYRYGMVTGAPETLKTTAEALGYTYISSAQGHEERGLERIRKAVNRRPVDPHLERKRELNRLWMARKRAKVAA